MIVDFDERLGSQLKPLADLDPSVGSEICSTAINFFKNGINQKLYSKAANKLRISVETIQTIFESIVSLVYFAANFKLSEDDFQQSISKFGLHADVVDTLIKAYSEHMSAVRQSLSAIDSAESSVPSYSNLEWRLECVIRSRFIKEQMKPRVILRIQFKSSSDGQPLCAVLKSDIANLIHFLEVLDEAHLESRSSHCLKILRRMK